MILWWDLHKVTCRRFPEPGAMTKYYIWDLSVPMLSTPSSSLEISQTSDRNCNFKHSTIHIIEAFYAVYWHSSVNWNISLSYKLVFVYHSTHNVISALFNDRKLRKEAYGCYCVFHYLLSCMLLINKLCDELHDHFYDDQMVRHKEMLWKNIRN